ncbi:interleukin-27 receptor subunit alpha isoform X3 [Bos taurus]|uniref:interleukin-27 receptor subunit alpha isoform X3 n=1 Tax=Bos taurus TaxID=9913 RepID=UPI0028CB2D02|nr:interleukin-27 receptor subunit alpha isoform X3 [Bos taurus]
MRGTPAAPFPPRPKPMLLLLLLLLFSRTRPQGSPGPLQCYGVGPLGDLNCSWEPHGDLGAPSMLYVQSQKYHSNKTWTVAVPTGQNWVTIPREQLTMSDELLVWAAKAGQLLWSPVFVNLETRMKPDAPHLYPDVDFSDDHPLEAVVQWAPPTWPPHKVLVCRFYYRRCRMPWVMLEPEVKSIPLMPIEIQDLELATGYEMFGRCQVDKEEDLWGEWSPILPFQTPPSAPKDVWIMGNICGAPGGQEPLLLWKASGLCMQVTYRVWIQVKDQEVIQEETPYCNFSIPTQAEWVGVSAVNATSWELPTNLSLTCLGPDSAPHGVVVRSISGNTELLVTWQQEPGELQEHVVDWIRDGDPVEDLNWVRLPPGNLSAVLPVDFKEGVPYRITVTAISPWGLAPAPSVWKFREELVPLSGPVVWRIQDAPSGTPAVAWGEVPRQQLRGHLTHYTLCTQSGTRPSVCKNVTGSTRTITLPDLHWGPCKLWMTASTIAGQGPPGPSLQFHLPGGAPGPAPW